ncbi:MAG: hypothetical protein AAF629_14310 [Chloroflexota bacterium]
MRYQLVFAVLHKLLNILIWRQNEQDSPHIDTDIHSVTNPHQVAGEMHRLADHAQMVQVMMPSGAQMPYG